ncbi:hypothetical protein [Halovenus salina]|uniref:HEAT repeat domain-containing protein n=1 Tax=Halovenus salina TaxID=1510225 RepID=A0ABD5W9I3_9EURY
MDTATTDESGETDWTFLRECTDAYPPGVDDHHCSQILANVVARYVIRTRINQGPDAIPEWVVDYLMEITIDADTEWGWESAAAVGWAVGHSDRAVLDRVVDQTDTESEPWAMGILKHVTFADPEAGITLLERLLDSPDTREDLTFLRSLERPLKQDLPNFPQYWEPQTELKYEVSFTNEQMNRLLEVLGDAVHPKRLEKFDDQFAFDLQRAADGYGSAIVDRHTRRKSDGRIPRPSGGGGGQECSRP